VIAEGAHVERGSVYQEGAAEAERHKWLLSEKAGCDVGPDGFYQWFQEHWNGFLRARWLEHLQGRVFWIELDRGDFGLLQHRFHDKASLLALIIDRLKAGKENLDILLWAIDNQKEVAEFREILEVLDINSRRLAHRFDR
jgi:hypothetical protein